MEGLDIKNTAVLIIDMQNAFLKDEGSIGKMGIPIERAKESIPEILKTLPKLRKAGFPVVYTKMSLRPDYEDAGILKEAFPPLHGLGHCVAGTWDEEIIDELKPAKDDYIILKNRFDGFYNTGLDTQLRCLGVKNLIVMGIATNICLEATVRSAFHRDYRCFVPLETTRSYTEDMEKGAIENFRFGFAKVMRIDELFTQLGFSDDE